MRLPSYESGTRLDQRVFLKVTRLVGADVDDVGKSALRRPDFFGRPFLAFAHLVLRGPSAWSIGERELFAAVVSRANTCRFCLGTHGEIAAKEMGRDVLDRLDAGR
jgi:AhpD family alkylhydroperoxidase